MKKWTLFLMPVMMVLITGTSLAQQKPYEITVSGVKVIIQPTDNDIVEIETVIKGGVQNYPAEKMGIEALALAALTECGTLKHDKNSFKNALDKVSAELWGYDTKEYALIRMNCVKSDFAAVWPLYAEAITQPAFNPKEFERIKQDAISNIRSNNADPDVAIDKYADKMAFAGRDYAKDPDGSVATLSKLTAAETKAFYNKILTRSRLIIVVVANLPRAEIEAKVAAMLAGIKPGLPFEAKKSFYRAYKNTFSAEKRDLATNYIEGITSGPEAGTPDYNAFNVAMRIFSDRHFLEVRTNNGLSYAPAAWFSVGNTSVAKFSVSTKEPDKYIAVFDKLVDKVKSEGFNAAEVADMKTTYLTGFYYKNETNQAQAEAMVNNEILHNNWRRSITLVDDIRKLTPEEISDAFRKYIGNIIWVYQGDPKKVNPLLYTNGTLNKGGSPVSH